MKLHLNERELARIEVKVMPPHFSPAHKLNKGTRVDICPLIRTNLGLIRRGGENADRFKARLYSLMREYSDQLVEAGVAYWEET